jgi:poly-gamma-glutamate synthesis protein (capsule biosynthesis protein)
LVIGNFEGTLGGEKHGYSGYPAFSAPDELADELKNIGFNVLLLANNHVYDKGISGLKRTIEELDSRGFFVTGAWGDPSGSEDNAPLIIEVKGIKIGILNYSYGSNYSISEKIRAETHLNLIDDSSIIKDINYLQDNEADFLVASFHWGNEYQPAPSKRQRELADMCFKKGVDIVIGTHPHILQPIEVFESNGKIKMAAFSLGNFISFQRTTPRERSVILAVNIREADGRVAIRDISLAPIYVSVKNSGKDRVVQVIPAPANIESSVLDFLNVPKQKDDLGFYILHKN